MDGRRDPGGDNSALSFSNPAGRLGTREETGGGMGLVGSVRAMDGPGMSFSARSSQEAGSGDEGTGIWVDRRDGLREFVSGWNWKDVNVATTPLLKKHQLFVNTRVPLVISTSQTPKGAGVSDLAFHLRTIPYLSSDTQQEIRSQINSLLALLPPLSTSPYSVLSNPSSARTYLASQPGISFTVIESVEVMRGKGCPSCSAVSKDQHSYRHHRTKAHNGSSLDPVECQAQRLYKHTNLPAFTVTSPSSLPSSSPPPLPSQASRSDSHLCEMAQAEASRPKITAQTSTSQTFASTFTQLGYPTFLHDLDRKAAIASIQLPHTYATNERRDPSEWDKNRNLHRTLSALLQRTARKQRQNPNYMR
ncbi:hypothetical protein BDY24DRAFT_372921, partial [Mrakia frigida]|uniref:uncharacterized protein n=1 Tax=Mrakia frigida TaxID=29902 RepID=UPI003FCC13F1